MNVSSITSFNVQKNQNTGFGAVNGRKISEPVENAVKKNLDFSILVDKCAIEDHSVSIEEFARDGKNQLEISYLRRNEEPTGQRYIIEGKNQEDLLNEVGNFAFGDFTRAIDNQYASRNWIG